jgi:hypothetical protein
MGEDDRLFQFLRGLRPAISTQLRMQGVTLMEQAISAAVRVGSMLEMGSALAVSVPTPSAAAPAPMELDAMLSGVEGLEPETQGSSSSSTDTVTRAELHKLLNAMREDRRGAGAGHNKGGGSYQPRGLPRVQGLTPEQVKAYMDAGKCFTCGGSDHRSRQCPKRSAAEGQQRKQQGN